MNVTFLTTRIGWGGTERYVVDLAEALKQCGVQTRVIADEPPVDRMKQLNAAGVETILLGQRYLSNRESYQGRLRDVLQSGRPDLVHVNAWDRRGWIARAVTQLKLPMLSTEHNTQRSVRVRDVLGINRRPFCWHRQVLEAMRRPVPAISISNRSLENLQRRTFRLVKSVRIYCGVNIPEVASAPRAFPGRRVIWVGSMIARKRPRLAIDSVARASALCPGISMVMIGDGPLLAEMRRRAMAVPSVKIEFRGNIDHVIEEMGLSDVFLQTSADEGISYAVLEAMSAGLPVLATDVGATSEAVLDGVTGHLAGAKDTASHIADRLVSLFADQEASRRLGMAGLERCRQVFSLSQMVKNTLDVYSAWSGRS